MIVISGSYRGIDLKNMSGSMSVNALMIFSQDVSFAIDKTRIKSANVSGNTMTITLNDALPNIILSGDQHELITAANMIANRKTGVIGRSMSFAQQVTRKAAELNKTKPGCGSCGQ